MNNLISIIVPVYNVEKYLDECICSLVAQTYKNIEIILVNDGSTDSSGIICEQYKEKDSRIVVIHKSNGGLSDARNTGIKAANGDLLMFVDSDDYVAKDFADVMYREMRLCDADLVACGFFLINQDGSIKGKECNQLRRVLSAKDAIRLLIQDKEIKNYAWNKIYKKEYFDLNCKFPNGRLFEDIAIIYKIFLKCSKIAVIENELYYYRVRSGSIMDGINLKREMDCIRAHVERYNVLSKCYPDLISQLLDKLIDYLCAAYAFSVKLNAYDEKKECIKYARALYMEFRMKNSALPLKRKLTFWMICRCPAIANEIFAATGI